MTDLEKAAHWVVTATVGDTVVVRAPGLKKGDKVYPRPQQQAEPVVDGNTSDGYHTFNELYDFRMSYNAALFNEWAESGKHSVHKSRRHHDGELCFGGGYFVVVAVLPEGQISNHYKEKYWDLFDIPQAEKALFEFDGHTGSDVLSRLKSYRPQQAEPVADKAQCDGGACGVGGYCDECPKRQAEPVAVQLEPFIEEASTSVLVLSGEKWVREGRAVSTAVQAEPVSLRPKQHDYASYVGYTRALEAYCDGLEQAEPVALAHKDILRMAREAGWPASVLHPHGPGVDTSGYLLVSALERFAALVRADVVASAKNLEQQAEPVVEPVTEAVEPVVVQAEPVGWLCSPDGHFKRNPLYRVEFPPESLAWQVPIYAAPQQQAEPAADSGNPSY
jgi:hypothetical protein